jgi:hypothetical protein
MGDDVGIFGGHLVYFSAIWYILWPFGIFFGYLELFLPVLVCKRNKNLAALLLTSVFLCGAGGGGGRQDRRILLSR